MKCTQCKHSLYKVRTADRFVRTAMNETGLCLHCDIFNRIIPVTSTDQLCKHSLGCSQFMAESCVDPAAYKRPPDPFADHFQRALTLHNRKKGGKELSIKIITKSPPL